ncbi:Phage shock protein A (IM30), suppresses sigma54-dependent transcription [Hahella chejuensis KCTC 2396]|uniref:Phage shock protein A (IM30), suppresses sigma54-dependent transcription n=1 Tax=Hahella chejuensis (strain KCTC 2396) TaxID=349521 RepID=Q2S7Z2_HAHCH|nr:PspA/IM30 family protein [Hahella chejuensis]ABC33232.1 Phage shock protein A (IM30), suppresses sigma54-dependent transcription [Hahella chejuensis KCTC 2396]
MSVWKKLVTAIKGGANEAAEAVVDSQALRILDQEIREAKEELRKSDHALTQIMAKRKLADQKVASLKASVAEYEGHARKAADSDRNLALECAQKVVELRDQMDAEQKYVDQFNQSEQTLRRNIAQAKSNLRRMEQQIDMVKATESVQKAQVAVSSRHMGANSKMKTAAESLQRIQSRQNQRSAELDAAEELASEESGDSLDAKLKAAGINGSNANADDELARILGGN